MDSFTVSGNIVNLVDRKIFSGTIVVSDGVIASVTPSKEASSQQFILPGFIDAHVHVESSMLVPSEFARLAVPHGTVATVSDPHEIGNEAFLDGDRCSTYLEYNARRGHLLKVKFILAHAANPNETHQDKHLPTLYAAIEGKDQEVIKEIIKKGARPLDKHPLSALNKRSRHPGVVYDLASIAFAEAELAAID